MGRTRHYHWGVTLPGRTTRSATQTFWNETGYDLNGNAWATQNANDMVYSGIADAAQRASVALDYTAVPGTTTSEVQTRWDFVSQFTPVEPTCPNGGSLVATGTAVAGPTGGNPRYRISIPTYARYSYEIYGNPTMANLAWGALPFALTQTGTSDRNIYTATSEGTLDLYVEAKSAKGFYYVSFRVPGSTTGTP